MITLSEVMHCSSNYNDQYNYTDYYSDYQHGLRCSADPFEL